MKKLLFSLAALASVSFAQAQCGGMPKSLNVSTGYLQTASMLLPDGTQDDDWIMNQKPAGATGTIGAKGWIIPKHSGYDWAGTTSKYMNYQNSTAGPSNWYDNTEPFVYQNGFCICFGGPIVNVQIELDLHCDNWSEVYLLDAAGNIFPIPGGQPLISQTHQHITGNFQNPTDGYSNTVQLPPGQYSLALLQRNKTSITAVSVDGSVTVLDEGAGIESGVNCGFTPSLPGTFHGSTVTTNPNPGGGGGGIGPTGIPTGGCPTTLIASTGFDNATNMLIADGVADDDWEVTQVPPTTWAGFVGQPNFVIPKKPVYDWAGPTAKWVNFWNGLTGPDNWNFSNVPYVYQNAFCVCGSPNDEAVITFELDLHSDNWAEVWLMDQFGVPVMPVPLLTQQPVKTAVNYQNPTDHITLPVTLNPGKYSLALVVRNGAFGAPFDDTGVSLNALITGNLDGVINGNMCSNTPMLSGTFYGTMLNFMKHARNSEPLKEQLREAPEIKLFPNPASGVVEIEGASIGAEISITDLHGRTVLQTVYTGNSRLDVSAMDAGVYMVRVRTLDTEDSIQKLVVR